MLWQPEPWPCEQLLRKSFQHLDLLCLARPCGIAADDLDFLGGELVSAFAFEFHVLHEEGPHVVAEAVGLQVSLVLI